MEADRARHQAVEERINIRYGERSCGTQETNNHLAVEGIIK
jgi:hypothetical protein